MALPFSQPDETRPALLMQSVRALLAFIFLAVGLASGSAAQSAAQRSQTPIDPTTTRRPSLRANRSPGLIDIDGRLNETAWQTADSTDTDFIQIQPRPGFPSSERTVVRVVYDLDNLYIGVVLHDSEPDKLTVPGLEQDYATQNSDIFGIAIDSYLDKQSAFVFAINPAGAVFDAQSFNDSRYLNTAWEGVINVKTTVHAEGWTIEAAIPMTTLRFSETDGEQTWGLNFSRRIRRRNEDSNWAPLARQFRLYKMSRAGTLTGLQGLRQGRNLAIKPYVTGARGTGSARTTDLGNKGDAGIDIKWGVTPRLTLDLTALTDFSQVEVDAEQVNLTRFSLFFPEKRDFFLENDGIFTLSDISVRNYRTGSSARNFKLFHSRQIGLSPGTRRPVPIAGGGRLSGRVGNIEIGLLEMQTRLSPELPGENFSVARVKGTLTGNSDVGFMFINRQGTSSGATRDYNRAFGADANFRVLGNMIINSYMARTDEPNAIGDRNAAMLQVAWRDPLWDASTLVKHVGDGFNPEVGFVNRRAIRQWYGTVGAHPQPDIPHVLEINPYVEVDAFSDLDWEMESRRVTAGTDIIFLDGGRLTFQYEDSFERLATPSTIAGVTLPMGNYNFGSGRISYVASGGRAVSGRLTASTGSFYDGNRTSFSGGIQVRPNYHLAMDFGFQRNDLDLGGTQFTANLYSSRLRYAHNAKLFFLGFVQYNEASEEMVTNLRFNAIHSPLSDIFLVFTERRDVSQGLFRGAVLDRVITAKVTKLFAF